MAGTGFTVASPSPDVSEVTLRMGDLEISVKSIKGVNETVNETVNELHQDPQDEEWSLVKNLSTEDDETVLNARDVKSLEDLVSGPLGFLELPAKRLTGKDSTWSPKARLAKAYQDGVLARHRFLGILSDKSSPAFPPMPFKAKCCFIVLQCHAYPDGFWTTSSQIAQKNLSSTEVVFSFASKTEGFAFLRGANRSWPKRVEE